MKKIKQLFFHPLFKEFSVFSSSTIIYRFSSVFVGLVAAKLLGPTLWGIWYFLNMALIYKNLANLGIGNGMNREVPIHLGKGKEQKAEKLQDTTFTTVLFTSVISCFVLLVIALFIGDPVVKSAVLWLIPLFIAVQFFQLVALTLKANSMFYEVSRKQFIFAFLFPVVAIPLTFLVGLKGFIIGFAIASFLSAWFIYRRTSISYSFAVNLGMAKELIRIGFPIMAVGITYAFLNTADRWIIGLMLGVKQLGYYSIAIMIFGAMAILPKIISQQLYPRMAFDWGESNNKEDLKSWIDMQAKYTAYLVVPLLVIVLLIAPPLIRSFLPEYIPSILPLQIIVFSPLFMSFSSGWGNFLNIIDKQIYYLAIIIFAVIVNLLLNYILVVNGYGLAGVAFGTALTFALYNIAITFVGKYFYSKVI